MLAASHTQSQAAVKMHHWRTTLAHWSLGAYVSTHSVMGSFTLRPPSCCWVSHEVSVMSAGCLHLMELKFLIPSSLLVTHQGTVILFVSQLVSCLPCITSNVQCTVTFDLQHAKHIIQCTKQAADIMGLSCNVLNLIQDLCHYHRSCCGQLGQAARWSSIMPYEAALTPPWLGDPRSPATPIAVGLPPTAQPSSAGK